MLLLVKVFNKETDECMERKLDYKFQTWSPEKRSGAYFQRVDFETKHATLSARHSTFSAFETVDHVHDPIWADRRFTTSYLENGLGL